MKGADLPRVLGRAGR